MRAHLAPFLFLFLLSTALDAAEGDNTALPVVETIKLADLSAALLIIDNRPGLDGKINVGGDDFATEAEAIVHIKTLPKNTLKNGILLLYKSKVATPNDALLPFLKEFAKTSNADLYCHSPVSIGLNDHAFILHKKAKE